ncbi:MAG: multifunctional CCA addition/repair protein [Magnetococcales bacterium]|nr:multifunctional CCA addition/repair protein [Magnetococcales bacterium]
MEPSDRDWVVVGLSQETMLEMGFSQVGRSFPVFIHPDTGEEYALARREKKSGIGYTGFSTECGAGVSLQEDLARRDLTINAIAMDQSGGVFDPFSGRDDLEKRSLRHVTDAFAEDPLRVLRVARFHARLGHLGFSVAEETLRLMRDLVVSGELNTLTPERVWAETEKALNTLTPALYFHTLHCTGALSVVFPELHALIGKRQPPRYHPEGDAWQHVLAALSVASTLTDDPALRFAALVHDIGKGVTPEVELPHHHGHDARGVGIIESLCNRLRLSKRYKLIALLSVRLHMRCHVVEQMTPKGVLRLFNKMDLFRHAKRLDELALICTADRLAKEPWQRIIKKNETLSELSPPPPVEDSNIRLLRHCFDAVKEIDHTALVAEGYEGEAFGQALHKKRLRAVSHVLKSDGRGYPAGQE